MDRPQEIEPAMTAHALHHDATNAASPPPGGDRLTALRSRIAQVARRRRLMRRLSAASRLALAIVIAAAAVFLVDWIFEPGRLARLLMLLVAAAVITRVYLRRVRPGLTAHESEAAVALLIEKQQGIDSDLMAALEFADGRAAPGSADLRDAVVDYVADFGRSWEMPRESVDPRFRRRLGWLALALAIVGTAAAARPDVVAAFVQRMFLGAAHYPTRTRIESLVIGGQGVDPTPGAAARVPCPLGRPIGFEVGIGGEPPQLARLRIKSVQTGNATEIDLVSDAAAQPADAPPSVTPPAATTYSARLPKLAESVDVQVFAGDAWTEPVRVTAIAPPLIDIALSSTPPSYAGGRTEQAPQGARQVTVLEGSRVDLALRCTNKKLVSATLVLDGAEHPLEPRPTNGPRAPGSAAEWELATARSPLQRLDRTVAYEIRIVDEDGLGADMPLVGSIRVKPDAAPRVTADAQTRLVLPTATPRLAWRVADDHAIARLEIVAEAVPAAGDGPAAEAAEGGSPAARPERTLTVPIPLSTASGAGWVGGDRLPLAGTATVELARLGLKVGDQVRVTARAVDYRGDAAGREAASEPILLDVTDERGILAGLLESDERSVEQLDAIINRELTVGGAR
jgi:hypothetical protein